ncbi:MAG: rod shape-determining protein MreD [Trichococcus flocculiformis]
MVQNRSLHHTYFIPVVLYVLLILDGFLINAFPGQFVSEEYILVPHLALFGFVLFSYYFPKQPMQLYAVLFGLLFDSYYSGILGVYAVAFSVIVYFVKKMQKYLTENVFVLALLFILAIVMVDSFVFGFYSLIDITQLDFSAFASERLGPTIVLNIVLFIVFYYPLLKLVGWMYD